jgi:CRISPR-associated protein Csm2
MPSKDVHTLMTADEAGAELVTFAQQAADRLVTNNLTRSQIRTVFTEVRQIEAQWGKPEAVRRLNMLKPKLAYQTARSNSVDYLREVLSEAIDEVVQSPADKRDERFQRFVDLFEAILAYHRAKGGRN